ncbi:MAG TPA: hypothetical protein VGQ72_07375 [Pyrinomonadaceae bacterium]|jgi:hypothetical protein|nr:hypothetical protein [Pyrinomonadaceae bacterium]
MAVKLLTRNGSVRINESRLTGERAAANLEIACDQAANLPARRN